MNNCIICSIQTKNKKLCGNPKCKSEHSRNTIRNSFKKHGGEITRFRHSNGMHRPEVRAQVSAKLRAMGWKPTVRGGNGHPPTPQQQALAEALGWDMEVVIPTNQPRPSNFPTCYKVDIGNQDLQVAVEVDGNSHNAIDRKQKDRKKDDFLKSLGWIVVRFTNQEVDQNLIACNQMVRSISENRDLWR